ncbi:MAG TPA: tetratricopeptide repeat protein, partial [Chloroflexota bacterium]|nr:tetratricopeptide repeat protein [Chloroflexota bacterium]
ADAALERVLAIDPKNGEALALKARWQVEPAPTFTPDEFQARQREAQARLRDAQVRDLLGAAASFITAGDPAQAIPHLQEALRLDPENATARATLHRLAASD